ncbi:MULTISPECIES: alpha-amylase family protein [unclassified Vibrio]|uniref:Alpha-amylase family protein n=1 Tax=Vibrio sp. HB236076 TaxID=3232307 RepID=A0AB39HEQ1_9VIBR|nr:alpha-amylase family protein [Vibrio sp. HB161653]MDP5253030.1 alpha-amylase family protein [Vibrio sp. HB161653]
MYEPVSHTLLNQIFDDLAPKLGEKELRFFYSRLGANFYAIHGLFERLYGNRDDFYPHLRHLVEVLTINYIERSPELRKKDREREENHQWFLDQKWVGMALYADGFAKDLQDLTSRIDYFSELGVNFIHILPIMECPIGKSDGGYAVSNFRKVDERVGTNEQLLNIINHCNQTDTLIALDMVVNHTSDQHQWAMKAKAGDKQYQDCYYMFDNRDIPDMFEHTMPDIFPEQDPGNFTYNEQMNKWVMTVFNSYQWDLNYTNPAVFIEMLENILFWANQGVDILRLDAVAFLWKKMGTACQNEEEAHLILQLFKDCCQIVSPGLLFIAEAIVSPTEIIKYFGEDAVVAKECEIAYNATYMALIWDAVATKNAKLLSQGIRSLPGKLEQATWLNYLRCHDDIGFGFDDNDIYHIGYDAYWHRKFLIDYFTGQHPSSDATGRIFGQNDKTGDARISGSLASLVGLEQALASDDPQRVDDCCRHITLLHSLIMSFGGIPLLYYGDEVGMLNDYSFESDEQKSHDSRWLHRPRFDWQHLERRHQEGTVQQRIFQDIRKLIEIRKATPSFADFNNRELLELNNDNVFGFVRYDVQNPSEKVYVIANMSLEPQTISLHDMTKSQYVVHHQLVDLWTGTSPTLYEQSLVLGGFQFYWLKLA